MMFAPGDIYEFVAFLVGLAGLWALFASKMTAQEQRQTRIEMLVEKLEEQLMVHQRRLDNHDTDNKIMLQLVEQVKGLKEDIAEIKQKLD